MKRFSLWLTIALIFTQFIHAQSPNFNNSTQNLDLSGYQQLSGKNTAGGYAGIDSGSGVVLPGYLFPGFSGASDNTVWVKSGSAMVAINSLMPDPYGLTSNGVRIGLLGGTQYGVDSMIVGNPLFLKAGTSNNRIYISNGQTIGGSNSDGSNFLWSIGTGGVFNLANGQFTGQVDLTGNNLIDVGTIAGTSATLNFSSPGISVPSGNFVIATSGTGAGTVVSSNASNAYPTLALNVTSANALYASLSANETFAGTVMFGQPPVVPDGSFAISATAGLQTALNSLWNRNGTSAATANINMGGYKLINLATPTLGTDAVNLNYLIANYISNPVASLVVQPGTPVVLSSSTGPITLSIPIATTTTSGYLTSSDWNTFNAKQAALAAGTDSTNGYLVATDRSLFAGNTSTLIVGTTIMVDTSRAKVLTVVLTNSPTFAFTSHRAGRSFYVKIQQDGAGNHTVTWDAAVRWPGDSAPTLTATASQTDLFFFVDDGTYYLGSTVGLNYSEH